MNKLSNFLIYLHNLSDIYILSTVTTVVVILIAIYCAKIMNRNLPSSKNSKTTKDPIDSDEEEFDGSASTSSSLAGKIKAARLKEIEKSLTHDQIEEERRIEQAQLAAIFELLKKQEIELNTAEIDEEQLREQLGLYR